jgi:hypothetical protein
MRCLEEAEVALFFEGRLDSFQIETLERHIEVCPGCLSLVAAVAPALASGPVDPGQISLLRVGDLLAGRYRVEAILGAGATGYVYQARDLLVETVVALKVLRPRLADDPAWVRALVEELQLARRIVHPNVCRVFDMQQTDGHSFLTMELASGGSLRDDIRRAAGRPAAEKLADAVALTRGLAAIHAAGIAHRDVKPANVLRTEDGRVLLSDFGLARASLSVAAAPRPVGTPAYMAPEVASGGPASPLSDVWSLGVTLRELYFGEKADARTTAEEAGKTPRDPMGRAMARLCAECLAVAPGDRPAHAGVVLERLEALCGKRRSDGRRRTWQLALGVSALVAGGAVVIGQRLLGQAGPPRAPEVAPTTTIEPTAAAPPGPDDWRLRLEIDPSLRGRSASLFPARVAGTALDLALKADPGQVAANPSRARALPREARLASREPLPPDLSHVRLEALLAEEAKLAQVAPEDGRAIAARCRLLESAVGISGQPSDALWSRALDLCRRAAEPPIVGLEAAAALARLQARSCEPATAVRSYHRAAKQPSDQRYELLVGWATLALRERWPHGARVDERNVGVNVEGSMRAERSYQPPLELLLGALHLQAGDPHTAYMMFRVAVVRRPLYKVHATAVMEGLRRAGKAIQTLPRSERTKFDGTPESSEEQLIKRIRSWPRGGPRVIEEIAWTAPARAIRLLAALPAPETCAQAIEHALLRRSLGALRPEDAALSLCDPASRWVQRCQALLQVPLGAGDPFASRTP